MSLIVTCSECGAKVEGLLEYEAHARQHDLFHGLPREVAHSIDLIVQKAAGYAVRRDSTRADQDDYDHWNNEALAMAAAAHYGAEAGLCDMNIALDFEAVREEVSRLPEPSDYAMTLWRAIEANR